MQLATDAATTTSEERAVAAYFTAVSEAFQAARTVGGESIERRYAIGGLTLRLYFAGPALLPSLTPALSHLQIAHGSPAADFTVCLWDSASTRTAMPSPPWRTEDYQLLGEIRNYNSARFRTVFQQGSQALSMLDRQRRTALYWVADAAHVPYYESSAPLRTLLHWWMSERRGRLLIHAGAVGTPERGGALLGGKSGSGKSTVALACLGSNLRFLGDDYVLLDTAPAPFAYSLYSSAKLKADGLDRFPHLRPVVSNPDGLPAEKAVVFLQPSFSAQLINGLPIRALLLPRVTNRARTRLVQTTAADGLKSLAPNTIFQLPGAGRQTFTAIARLVEQVPSYILELGADVSEIPQVILELLTAPPAVSPG